MVGVDSESFGAAVAVENRGADYIFYFQLVAGKSEH